MSYTTKLSKQYRALREARRERWFRGHAKSRRTMPKHRCGDEWGCMRVSRTGWRGKRQKEAWKQFDMNHSRC